MINMNNDNLDSQIREKALKIMDLTSGKICPRCLGRNFSHDIEAPDNLVRGEYIQNNLNQESCADGTPCYICGNIFQNINNELIEYISQEITDSNIEFDTFLIGSRVDKDIIEREKEIQEKIGVDVENIKKEINREIGKALSVRIDKEVDFETPHLVILVDFTREGDKPGLDEEYKPRLEFQINPLFIEGRYRKLLRGIPQTKWPCRECKGKGCERCNYTGKMYQESVEELVSPEFLKQSQGSKTKFHGAGREDIDVRMLGTGRPFVLEIKEPHRRALNLKNLEDEVNQSADGKVEISGLEFVGKERRKHIKTSSTDSYKVYNALVKVEKEVTPEDMELIKSLKLIDQRTPQRVVHRRADIIRNREVRNIEVKQLDGGCLELIIECQGGLYIKELISGDDNRTFPNVSSLLETKARCVQLDVLNVHVPE